MGSRHAAPGTPGVFMMGQEEQVVEMDAKTLETLKEHLEKELVRLEAEVAQFEEHERVTLSEASGENAYRDHMADQGSATFERELDMTLEDNVRGLLADVRVALARIEAGTYGMCERCDSPIPGERMEAVPTASLCIKCKAEDESR
jgi:DnaK suppressor protein